MRRPYSTKSLQPSLRRGAPVRPRLLLDLGSPRSRVMRGPLLSRLPADDARRRSRRRRIPRRARPQAATPSRQLHGDEILRGIMPWMPRLSMRRPCTQISRLRRLSRSKRPSTFSTISPFSSASSSHYPSIGAPMSISGRHDHTNSPSGSPSLETGGFGVPPSVCRERSGGGKTGKCENCVVLGWSMRRMRLPARSLRSHLRNPRRDSCPPPPHGGPHPCPRHVLPLLLRLYRNHPHLSDVPNRPSTASSRNCTRLSQRSRPTSPPPLPRSRPGPPRAGKSSSRQLRRSLWRCLAARLEGT